MFAVNPLSWCPHLESIVPIEGLLDTSALCETCSTPRENWVCLTCQHVHCGRYINKHMLEHSEASGHNIVLSYADLSVWCFTCDSYVYNPVSWFLFYNYYYNIVTLLFLLGSLPIYKISK